MAIRVRGRKRSLSKKVSSFNMYDDQVYQIRAIMESTGEYKDAPVIRQLLDEALTARRLKVFGYADNEPPGQGTAESIEQGATWPRRMSKNPSDLAKSEAEASWRSSRIRATMSRVSSLTGTQRSEWSLPSGT